MNTKPILFNTDAVRAILDNRKTVTRRAVKGYVLEHLELDTDGSIIGVYGALFAESQQQMTTVPCQSVSGVRQMGWDRFVGQALN